MSFISSILALLGNNNKYWLIPTLTILIIFLVLYFLTTESNEEAFQYFIF